MHYSEFLNISLQAITAPKYYVAGFLFRNQEKEVALIEKLHPEWQKGKLNGIGGKIIDKEAPFEAMCREFKEEAGIEIGNWELFCILNSSENKWKVFMFKANLLTPEIELKSMEEERVNWYNVNDLSKLNVISNLRWLIPMALNDKLPIADVTET
jgi:8-oxo-dGTP diphosphatase